ncbi:MAG TPA: F0F1 ATP synthase subunit delta [Candidatus Omnitrophota bacterium]|nr:F0F1 ATP synthase subunit delta [Candidatus Omnitrophota bacterium]
MKEPFLLLQAIILQVIFFAGLVFVLRKVLLSSSYAETKRLQQLNEENTQKAQELAAKVAEAENEYREKMLKTDEEIRLLKAKAKKEIEDLKEAIIAKGKAEGDRIVTQALNARDEIRAEIEEQMNERAIDLSRKIFRKVLGAPEQQRVHEGLIEGVLSELEKMDKEQLQAIPLDKASQGKVQVKTAHPLSADQKKRLETILTSRLGQSITAEETVGQEIIAGIVITLGSFVIDGSFAERFNRAAASMK